MAEIPRAPDRPITTGSGKTWPEARILADEGKLVRRRSWAATSTDFAWIFNDRGLYFFDNFTLTNGKLTAKGQRKIVTNLRFTSADFLATDWQDETEVATPVTPPVTPVTPVVDPRLPVVDPKPPISDPPEPDSNPSTQVSITLTTSTTVDNDIELSYNGASIGTRVNLGTVSGRDGQKQKITYVGNIPSKANLSVDIISYGTEHYSSSPWTMVITRSGAASQKVKGGVNVNKGDTDGYRRFPNGSVRLT